jgi:aspartate-semialdehyde dehydrogenase
MTDKKRVAVIGATGVVGKTILSVLEERDFPLADLVPAATDSSSGLEVQAFGESWPVRSATDLSYDGIDVCFFTAGAGVSKELIPRALKAGCRVVDNTTAFRMDPDVPLVVPEINASAITSDTRLASCPNCTTIVLVMALAPLACEVGVRRVVVTSLQSVSGAGKRALDELEAQSGGKVVAGKPVFERPIAFNCLPQIGDILDSSYTVEEEKIIEETRKILSAPSLEVSPTAVRVPVRVGHSVSVNAELVREVKREYLIELWNEMSGVRFDPTFATPLEIAGSDEVVVGRVRIDPTRQGCVSFWAVGDNLRKGAATNSVQIAEVMFRP